MHHDLAGARAAGARVVGEVELCVVVPRGFSRSPPSSALASTCELPTTALLGAMLEAGGLMPFVASGNLGISWLSETPSGERARPRWR